VHQSVYSLAMVSITALILTIDCKMSYLTIFSCRIIRAITVASEVFLERGGRRNSSPRAENFFIAPTRNFAGGADFRVGLV